VPLAEDFAVKVLNVSVKWFETADLSWHLLWQEDAACEVPGALAAFFQAFDSVQENHSRMAQEEALVRLYGAAGCPQDRSRAKESARIETALSLLRERFTEDISLTDLAASVDLTPSYFCRAFKNAVGLPPHAYQNSLRVARAKVLLEGGKTAGEVAAEVGFYDQSHLTMHVKRLLGATPQALLKG